MKRIWTILTEYDFAPVELLLILYSALWGVGMLMPHDTFRVLGVYRVMATIASETTWGLILAVMAAIHGYGLVNMRTSIRKVGLGCQMALWIAIAYLTFTAEPASLGHWHFALMAWVAFWCWVRLSRYV